MNGASVGTLNVYVYSGVDIADSVWTRRGPQGDRWFQGHITVDQLDAIDVRSQL